MGCSASTTLEPLPPKAPPLWKTSGEKEAGLPMKFRIGKNTTSYVKMTLPTKIKETVFDMDTGGGAIVLRIRGEETPLAIAKKGSISAAFKIFRPVAPFFEGQRPSGSHKGAPLFHYVTFGADGAVTPASQVDGVKPFAILDGPMNSLERYLFSAEGRIGMFKYNPKSKLHEIEVTNVGYDAALIICLTHLADLRDVDAQMSQLAKTTLQASSVTASVSAAGAAGKILIPTK